MGELDMTRFARTFSIIDRMDGWQDPYDEATRIMREMEQDPPADF